jgi:hypothetical protein
MTTLILHPRGTASITFDTDSATTATTGYYAPASAINLNIGQRKDIVYSETDYGGSAVVSKDRLAPIDFTAFIWGSDRQTMLQRSHALKQAVERGGSVEYRPTGASMSTFYVYEPSVPPTLTNITDNLWDRKNASVPLIADVNVISFDVSVMTKPIGRSELFEFIAPSRFTLDNTNDDATYFNWFELTDIKGDSPAIIQTRVNGNNEYSRFYICTRSNILSTFSNLSQIIEAESGSGTGWTNQVDASRSNGNYMRASPVVLDSWVPLKIPIPNELDHRGLVAIVPIIRASSSDFRIRVSYEVGDFVVDPSVWSGNTKYTPEYIDKWHALYCGEYTFPLIGTNDTLTISPKLVLNVLLEEGSGTFDIDCVHLLFSDESIMQIDISTDRTYGVETSDYLFLSTNDDNQRIAHIVDNTYTSQKVAERVFGTIALEAINDTRFFFLFERKSTETHLHVPTDQITIDLSVMHRTIYPFD